MILDCILVKGYCQASTKFSNRSPKAEKFATGRLLRGTVLLPPEEGGRAGEARAASDRRPHIEAFSRTGGEEERVQARRNLSVLACLVFTY